MTTTQLIRFIHESRERAFTGNEEKEAKQKKIESKESPVFLRLVDLWRKLIASPSLKIDYITQSGSETYQMHDEKSSSPLVVTYDYMMRLNINYNGLTDSISKELLPQYQDLLKITYRVFEENKINQLEEELTKR